MLKIYIYFFSKLDILFMPFMAKNQNTSTKFQINSKFEISMTETNCSDSRITVTYLKVLDQI